MYFLLFVNFLTYNDVLTFLFKEDSINISNNVIFTQTNLRNTKRRIYMGPIMSSALASGILSGLWALVGGVLSAKNPELFATWLGFVGLTSYFAAGTGKSNLARSVTSNLAGILIGCTIIALSAGKSNTVGAIITGIFSWLICYLAHIDLTRYAFCTFMGGFSAFATGGNWKMLVICILIGNLVGHLCVIFGNFLYEKFGDKNKEDKIIGKASKD